MTKKNLNEIFIKMHFFKTKHVINYAFFLIIILFNLSCSEENNYSAKLKGNTMGTYYLVSVIDIPIKLKIKTIESEIENTLIYANKILSN